MVALMHSLAQFFLARMRSAVRTHLAGKKGIYLGLQSYLSGWRGKYVTMSNLGFEIRPTKA
jgi:hypothetical protein